MSKREPGKCVRPSKARRCRLKDCPNLAVTDTGQTRALEASPQARASWRGTAIGAAARRPCVGAVRASRGFPDMARARRGSTRSGVRARGRDSAGIPPATRGPTRLALVFSGYVGRDMTDLSSLKAMLWTPEFWVTTVLGALLLNIVASYVKEGIDRVFATSSRHWRNRRAEAARSRARRVEQAANSPQVFMWLLAREARIKLRTVMYFITLVAMLPLRAYRTPDSIQTQPLSTRFFWDGLPFILLFLWVMDNKRSTSLREEQDAAILEHLARAPRPPEPSDRDSSDRA